MRDAKREDWPKIIAEIGLSAYKLAAVLGVDPTTVKNWIAGGEPKHCYGVQILRMHADRGKVVADSSHVATGQTEM